MIKPKSNIQILSSPLFLLLDLVILSDDEVDDKKVGTSLKKGLGANKNSKKVSKKKKVKSLGNFCQQFIRLFVTWKGVISLEEAAR